MPLTTILPDAVTGADRLATLQAYGVLDTPSEEGFEDIVHLAARACAAPVALVSLVDWTVSGSRPGQFSGV